jgi:hypothetical protein
MATEKGGPGGLLTEQGLLLPCLFAPVAVEFVPAIERKESTPCPALAGGAEILENGAEHGERVLPVAVGTEESMVVGADTGIGAEQSVILRHHIASVARS